MKISSNGFYRISDIRSDLSPNETISIASGSEVFLYDDTDACPRIEVEADAVLHYISFFHHSGSYDTHIVCQQAGAEVSVQSLLYAKDRQISARIMGDAQADQSQIHMNILAFAAEQGDIRIDGVLQIAPELTSVVGRLDETNVFLGESGKLSGLPTLLVASNDIDASHSCKMERISQKDMFYLRSRGMDEKSATYMMLRAQVHTLLGGIQASFPEQYDTLFESMIGVILEQPEHKKK